VARSGRAIRTSIKRGLLALAAALVAFLVCEGAARLVLPAWKPPPASGVPFFRPDPRLGWALREGWTGEFPLPHRTTHVAISEQGFRDAARAPHPPSGKNRVLVLGDSFGFGFGVEHEETFERRLETLRPDLEVVNAAVPGYGTDQELLLLEERGLALRPDLVLVLFHPNDLLNNEWPRQYGYPKPVFRVDGDGLRLDNVPVPGGRAYRLLLRTVRSSFLLNRLWLLTIEPTQNMHESPRLAWDVTERLLVRLRDESSKAGAHFVVVTFPWIDDRTNAALVRVNAFLAKDGLPHVDLGPDVVANENLERSTEHWTPAGHEAVARILARELGPSLEGR
jgi:hypothetical protein